MRYPVDIALEKYSNRVDYIAEEFAERLIKNETSVIKVWAHGYCQESAEKIYGEVTTWVEKRLEDNRNMKKLLSDLRKPEAREELGTFVDDLDKDLLAKGVEKIRGRIIDEVAALSFTGA